MVATDRPTDDSLEETLFGNAAAGSFFQLVHLIERGLEPGARVGHRGPASQERIRFKSDLSLAFPISDLVSIQRLPALSEEPSRIQVTTTFLGLLGSGSPLPSFYTEKILQGDPEGEAVRHFLDLFHHRLLSLFYRVWSKYRYHIQFEEGGEDLFSGCMFRVVGFEGGESARKSGLSPTTLIRYAGLLTQKVRSASALEGILSDYFDGAPTRLVQCTERWVTIRPEEQIRLGSRNSRLGIDMSIGERVAGRTGAFRVVVGPVGYQAFARFLPDQDAMRQLRALVLLFISDPLEFDIELTLRPEEIPFLRLSSERTGPRLGWATWLRSGDEPGGTPGSVVFQETQSGRLL